jgi:uncharacterized membrane protein
MALDSRAATMHAMYGDHMNGWWAWMAIMPVLVIAVLALAIYFAVRLGVRDGRRIE